GRCRRRRQCRARGHTAEHVRSGRRPFLPLLRCGHATRALPERRRAVRVSGRPGRARAPWTRDTPDARPGDRQRAWLHARVGDAARAVRHTLALGITAAGDPLRRARLPDDLARESVHRGAGASESRPRVAAHLQPEWTCPRARRAVLSAGPRALAARPRRRWRRPVLYRPRGSG